MSLQSQQNFLARLYTDEDLRRRFLDEPETIGAQNGLSKGEVRELAEVFPEELNFFAATLVWKRLREAEKFLPLTREVLGDDFSALFREFAQLYNPKSIKKHLEDAIEFCRFLSGREISEIARSAAKFEGARHEFYGYEKIFRLCRISHDVRKISGERNESEPDSPPRKTKFVVWVRFGKRIRHFFI